MRFLQLVDLVRTSGGVHKWKAHPVFDGAPSPGKANEDCARRKKRQTSLDEALRLDKLGRRDALKFFNEWWRPSTILVHEICLSLRDLGISFTVAPHEADGQISHLCNHAPPGSLAVTIDSDLAVTCKYVFFWDRSYDVDNRIGGGLYCVQSEMFAQRDGNKSIDGFSEHQFMVTCVLSGCDYISKTERAGGVGFVTAIQIVREHVTLDRAIHYVMSCGKFNVCATTPNSIRAAMYQFLYPIVYDPVTGSHVHRIPIPGNCYRSGRTCSRW